MEIWKFFSHVIAYRFLYIYERKVTSFQLVKCLAAKVKVEKRGKKCFFDPKWSPAKNFKNPNSNQHMGADFRSNEGSITF